MRAVAFYARWRFGLRHYLIMHPLLSEGRNRVTCYAELRGSCPEVFSAFESPVGRVICHGNILVAIVAAQEAMDRAA